MHFEWVGEPRNTLQYPSKYCPNVAGGGAVIRGCAVTAATSRHPQRVMFADDGWSLVDD